MDNEFFSPSLHQKFRTPPVPNQLTTNKLLKSLLSEGQYIYMRMNDSKMTEQCVSMRMNSKMTDSAYIYI